MAKTDGAGMLPSFVCAAACARAHHRNGSHRGSRLLTYERTSKSLVNSLADNIAVLIENPYPPCSIIQSLLRIKFWPSNVKMRATFLQC